MPDDLAREYDIVDELTPGGEADVAVIKHRGTGQLKVMKLYRSGITLPQSISDTLQLANQAHVLPVHRYVYHGWRSPRVIEVMDYLPDGSLEDLLQRSGGSAPNLARDILIEMTAAIDHIHNTMKLVHRDIKPANILISKRQPLDLVLADLGLAAQLADLRVSRRGSTGSVKGTLVYQSPESLNISDAGAPRDWWALGMTMCEVLTGRHPFKDSHGNTLRDENQIRHAITMGSIDLSMIRDQRWNLLCRGLLVHNPKDRWNESEVQAWLAGESPSVAAARPQQSADKDIVRPYRFNGHRITDPVELAEQMVTHWEAAASVFTSAEECATLRAWIREDVQDNTIEVNLLSPIQGNDQSKIDIRIIEFTARYRRGEAAVFRGERLTAADLAARYLRAGDRWEQDPLLSALTSQVLAALAETQLDENAGPQAQSREYHALAQLARYAATIDQTINEASSQISTAISAPVGGVDVGATVRGGLPVRVVRARGMARAALLSPDVLADIRTEFAGTNTTAPQWFANLAAKAPRSKTHPAPKIAAPLADTSTDIPVTAAMSLTIAVADLAKNYQQACLNAQAAAEHQRRQVAAEAAAAAAKAERTDLVTKTLIAGAVMVACLAAMFADRWLLENINPRDGWPASWAYSFLAWPSVQLQQIALIFGIIASIVVAIVINAVPDLGPQRDRMIFGLLGYGAVCLLPLVGVLISYAILVALAIAALVFLAALGIGALLSLGD